MITNTEYNLLYSFEKDNPIISVVLTNYNYSAFIHETLESIKNQTFEEIELIIVDDKSTDNSVEIIDTWLNNNNKRFAGIKFIQHNTNCGLTPCQSRNTGIVLSGSDYIFIMDSDNIIYPKCLAKLYNALLNSETEFAYSIIRRFGLVDEIFNFSPWDSDRLKNGNYIDAMALIKKDALLNVGAYDIENNLGLEDYDLWIRFAIKKYAGILVPEIFSAYRVHKNSLSQVVTIKNEKILMERFKTKYPEFFG